MEVVIDVVSSEIIPCDDENLCRMAFFGSGRNYVAMCRYWDEQDDGLYFEYENQATAAIDCVEYCSMGLELMIVLRPGFVELFKGNRVFRIRGIAEAERSIVSKMLKVLMY